MTLRNWAGNVTFGATGLREPDSVAELQELIGREPRIRALGTGHSFNRIADTDALLVSTRRLPPRIDIDSAASTVRVSSSLRYGDLVEVLDAAGFALANLGSLPHISVAGACATGTHGSGDSHGCLASQVVGVEFVRGDGELVHVEEGDAEFPGSVLALGALGVTTELTLHLQTAFALRQDVWLDVPTTSVLDRFDEIMGAGHSVSLFSEPERPDVVDQVWVKRDATLAAVDGRDWGGRPAEHAMHPVAGHDAAAVTEQLGAPGAWYARLPHFRLDATPSDGDEQQSEFFVSRADATAALDAVLGLDLTPAMSVMEIRTVARDRLWMSPFRDRDTMAVHVTWVNDDDLVRPALARFERALEAFDPRPHWAKVFSTEPQRVRAAYPGLDGFRRLVDQHDPDRTFGNTFLETFVY